MHWDRAGRLESQWLRAACMSEVPNGLEVPPSAERPVRASATIMLSREGHDGIEVMLCHRVNELPAFPGYWAFPGGGISRIDRIASEKLLGDFENEELAASLIGMMRELLEEIGWVIDNGNLLVANTESRNAVLESKENWLLEVINGKLPFNPSELSLFGRRTTPNFAPIRFDNRFLHFHAGPASIIPEPVLSGQTEFDSVRWDTPRNFLKEWRENKIKIPPPVISILEELEKSLDSNGEDITSAIEQQKSNTGERTIFFAYGVECIPVPTHTLPPASTTNTYILGVGHEHIIVDAAARTKEGLDNISRAIDRINENGGYVSSLLYTHRHLDHIGDINELQKLGPFKIMCSAETAEFLPCDVDRILVDGDVIELSSEVHSQSWKVLVTPGHCPGHICLHSEAGLVAGDMVAGIGTILIPPNEGNMENYITQLERLKELRPHLMFPSHGVVLPLPEKTLGDYIFHRRRRHDLVLESVSMGTNDLDSIANFAYSDTPNAHPVLSKQQTLSHLLSHVRGGKVIKRQEGWYPL